MLVNGDFINSIEAMPTVDMNNGEDTDLKVTSLPFISFMNAQIVSSLARACAMKSS